MKVLLIEDSARLQCAIGEALRRSGYATDVTGDGEEGLWMAQTGRYDAIILDVMLPGIDGFTILSRLRREGNQAHVLMLTAKDTVDDRVRGLEIGADDYLTKPFALDELLARVHVLCRRGYGIKTPLITIGDLTIDTGARVVRRKGEVIKLTAREFRLLEYLACRQGEVVSRTEIEMHLYDSEAGIMSNVVDSAVSTLRKRITPPGATQFIHTRRGLGYVLEAPS